MSQRYIWNNVYKLVNNQNIMKIHLDLTSSDAQIKWFHKVSKPTQPWNQRRFQCHYRNNSLQTCSTSKICNSTVWKHMPPSLCYLSYHAMLENCIANVFHFVGSSKKCTCIQIEIFDKNATKEKTQFKMYWVCLESASWCYSFISFLPIFLDLLQVPDISKHCVCT